MKFNEVITSLHSKDIEDVIDVLNNSVYITNFSKNAEGIVVDTGFEGKLHTGKPFRVFYDFESETIIRQPIIPNGRLLNGCGMYLIRKDTYYNDTILMIVAGYNISNHSFEIANPETEAELRSYFSSEAKFKILKDNDNKEEVCVAEFPLHRKLNTPVFFDGDEFSQFEWSKDDYEERPRSYEDGLRDEYGDEAGTAYWNHE